MPRNEMAGRGSGSWRRCWWRCWRRYWRRYPHVLQGRPGAVRERRRVKDRRLPVIGRLVGKLRRGSRRAAAAFTAEAALAAALSVLAAAAAVAAAAGHACIERMEASRAASCRRLWRSTLVRICASRCRDSIARRCRSAAAAGGSMPSSGGSDGWEWRP